jgi:hypothetical protein
MGLYLMVQEEIILRGLFPFGTIVVVFFVPICPLLFIIHLPNQQGNILLGVSNGSFPLVLTILVTRN